MGRYDVDDYIYGQTSSPQPTETSFESFQSPSMTYTIFRGAPRFAKTKQGIIGLSARNALGLEKRNEFLPVLKALLKVMETSTPAPKDVNTLLVLSRDLNKDIPKGEGGRSLPGFSGFPGVDLNGDLGLVENGDVIVDVEGVPHILTQFGAFPLSDVSLMTDEEREKFLPAAKIFISVLEKDRIDQNEINELIKQSEALQELIPEQWQGLIKNNVPSPNSVVNARTTVYSG